jgi:hypothetical protein
MMSLAERGLMDTMRRECWVNGSIPKEPEELAAYLGKSVEDIKKNLSIKVLYFFREKHDSLICPELDAYRSGLADKKQRMSEGGRRGGKSTQHQNKVAKATLEAMSKPLSGNELSRGEVSGIEKQSLGEGITKQEVDEWNADYDSAPEVPSAYLVASKGGH